MEHIINEQLKKLEYAISGMETISQIIFESPIDKEDKKRFSEILTRAYEKGQELNSKMEAHIKRKNKRVKFQPHHF
ncbi:MAG: hypothetical protein EU532_07055 [Promethearchaeota archaeon]|nr:MAG: hypothetical protein EU532_07055 [Candidatus Lokiarchaeota archaeon]